VSLPLFRRHALAGDSAPAVTSGSSIAAMWNATAPLVAASTALHCRLPRAALQEIYPRYRGISDENRGFPQPSQQHSSRRGVPGQVAKRGA